MDKHIKFLLDKDILQKWAHLSLKQRAKMFHRHYPDTKISASTIERIYFKGGVKYKYINKVKKDIDFTNEYYLDLFNTMYDLMK